MIYLMLAYHKWLRFLQNSKTLINIFANSTLANKIRCFQVRFLRKPKIKSEYYKKKLDLKLFVDVESFNLYWGSTSLIIMNDIS